MSVIERWTVYEPGEGADPVVYRGRFKLMTPGGPDIGRAVVVVSEADYLGAVEALEQIAAVGNGAKSLPARAVAMREIAEAAIAATRGQ